MLLTNNEGTDRLYVTNLSQFTSAEQAATALFDSIMPYTRIYNGVVTINGSMIDGYNEYTVAWHGGTVNWATNFVSNEDAHSMEFTTTATPDGQGVIIRER